MYIDPKHERPKIVLCDTLEDGLTELFGEEVMANTDDWVIGHPWFEEDRCLSDVIDIIRENHLCWGFARQPTHEVYLWLGDGVEFVDVMGALAHEFGHFEPTEFEDEEFRAESYTRISVWAWDEAKRLMGL